MKYNHAFSWERKNLTNERVGGGAIENVWNRGKLANAKIHSIAMTEFIFPTNITHWC